MTGQHAANQKTNNQKSVTQSTSGNAASPALEEVKSNTGGSKGITLKGRCLGRPTSIYFPNKALMDGAKLNILLWFHGWYVDKVEQIFEDNRTSLRESVDKAQQDLVLVAPFLGYVPGGPDNKAIAAESDPDKKAALQKKHDIHVAAANKYSAAEKNLGEGTHCFLYLQEVLNAIGSYRNKTAPTLQNLYLACHSGGGEGMLDVLGSLGNFKDNLKECWGFDCIYSQRYASKVTGNPTVNFYIYFGQGSSFLSTFDLYSKKYSTPPPSNMNNLFLAPATTWPGVDEDSKAFQTAEAIQKTSKNANVYETFRRDLDAELQDKNKNTKATNKNENVKFNWVDFLNKKSSVLMGHYPVPATLLTPRIKQSLAKLNKK